MNIHIDPSEFSDVIQAAVDHTIAKLRAEQSADGGKKSRGRESFLKKTAAPFLPTMLKSHLSR